MSAVVGRIDDGGRGGANARRLALEVLIRRAVVGGRADLVVLTVEGGGAPIASAQVHERTEEAARDVAHEIANALEDDASASTVASYRVVCQRGEETVATKLVHVRAGRALPAAADGTLLRGAHESPEAAVLRQTMRHHEATQALAYRVIEKTAEMQMRQTDRIMSRLEALEARASEFADRRRDMVAVEIEQESARAREKRMDDALRLVVPHVPRLVAALTKATLGENAATPAPLNPTGPVNSPAGAQAHDTLEAPADDGAAVLGVLAGMPPEAVAMLADVMRGEGKSADADRLLAVHARLKGKVT